MINRRVWFCALVFVASTGPVFAQQPQAAAGRIKIASGSAFIVRAGALAQAGEVVFEADRLARPAPTAVSAITLKDDTRVSLGPASEVRARSLRLRAG